MYWTIDNKDRMINWTYVDLNGNPVKRSKDKYRYSYDPHVVWKIPNFKGNSDTVYSDRLVQWDYDKYNRCSREIWGDQRQYFNNSQPAEIERFLSLYFEKEIKLMAIMEGCNVSSGYPYWVFYFKNK